MGSWVEFRSPDRASFVPVVTGPFPPESADKLSFGSSLNGPRTASYNYGETQCVRVHALLGDGDLISSEEKCVTVAGNGGCNSSDRSGTFPALFLLALCYLASLRTLRAKP